VSFVFITVKVPGAPAVGTSQPVHQLEKEAVPGTDPQALAVGVINRWRVVALFAVTIR